MLLLKLFQFLQTLRSLNRLLRDDFIRRNRSLQNLTRSSQESEQKHKDCSDDGNVPRRRSFDRQNLLQVHRCQMRSRIFNLQSANRIFTRSIQEL